MTASAMPPAARTLDLRQDKCPLNYVKASLALEKLAPGEILEVWVLPHTESARHIPASLRQDGHEIVAIRQTASDVLRMAIRRVASGSGGGQSMSTSPDGE